MRKLIWIMLAIISLQACNESKEVYNMEVDLDGSEGKWIKLMVREDRNYVTYDSVLAESGTPAVLSKGVEGLTTMYLTMEESEGSITMLVENSTYKVTGTLENYDITTDGKAQNDLNGYNEKLKPVTEQMSEMVAVLRKGPDPENPEAFESLREAYFKLYDQQEELDSAYIAENPSSYATVLALRATYYNFDAQQLEAQLTRLDDPLKQMEEYKLMEGKLERMKAVDIGQHYTDFGLETPKGEILKISDVHNGNVLLIDFWASWCGPCRQANPEVVKIYNQYHDDGFEIMGVSLDRDSADWVKAIADDQLTWSHISDLKYWNSEGAELYGVSSIPHTVLIDRDGIISAKNLHGDKLREAIESLL